MTTDDQPRDPSGQFKSADPFSQSAAWFAAFLVGAELPAAPARDESLDVFAALLGAPDPTTTTIDNQEGTPS